MSEIQSWSATAASNNSASPDGWPESMAPSGINNSARENMAALARWYKDSNGSLASGGSSNAYTLTPNRTISAYAAGIDFLFIANHANTGAATVNVSALGAKDIRDRDGAALASGDIEIGTVLHVVYDATNGYFRASNLIAGLGAGASNLDSLTDVAISTATSGDLLTYNGSSWVNSSGGATSTSNPYSYSTLPGGMILQAGKDTPIANGYTNYTFPLTFPTRCNAVTLTYNEANLTSREPLKVTFSNSGFAIFNPNAAAIMVAWIAVGY